MKKLVQALQKMVAALEAEKIDYMLVGGFAMSYYNRYRLTLDFDCVVQMWPHDIERLVAHFPEWKEHLAGFRDTAERIRLFNLTDLETGIKYDFMP